MLAEEEMRVERDMCYYSPIERMFAHLLRRHVEVLYGWPRLSYYDISPNLVELLAWIEGPDSTIPHHLFWRICDSIALVKNFRNHTRNVFQDQDLDALVQSFLRYRLIAGRGPPNQRTF